MKTHFVQQFPEGFRVVKFNGDIVEFFDFTKDDRGTITNYNQQRLEAEKKAAELSGMSLQDWQESN